MLKIVIPRHPHLKTLGDAHLGRVFKEGVPLHRLGERERNVNMEFMASLVEDVEPEDLVVQTGDLFDGFNVPNDVLLFAKHAVASAAEKTGAQYIFYRGNHDASRDTSKVSAFDLFKEFFVGHDTVHVYDKPVIHHHFIQTFDNTYGATRVKRDFTIGIMPWHPFKSAEELAFDLQDLWMKESNAKLGVGTLSKAMGIAAVYTHCDLDSFGENTFNVMPYAALAILTTDVINGHVHTPELRQHGTTEFHMVGSMQPFSHGEDPGHEQYLTLTLAQLEQIHPIVIKDKNVRLVLEPGEEVPAEIPDCMAFTVKKNRPNASQEPIKETELADFSVQGILESSFTNRIVMPKVRDAIMAHYDSIKGN